MANTNKLKTVVEKEMIDRFCDKYEIKPLKLDLQKNKIHTIFSGMEPDLIAYHEEERILYLGEITTSGYLGQRGRDFHVGAVKKISEAFSKFYLLYNDIRIINKRLQEYLPDNEIDSVKCFFIVPEGSKFINALGYRKKLFETRYMDLETIKLTKESHSVMIEVLEASKNENKQH
ncbi:MAG: hypothetical protein FH751_12595 [Firmicutes bacterium]|nr:hypothetical protein [Bacillota bacterium]